MIKMPGDYTRLACVPSIFNVSFSCLPTPKPVLCQSKPEDQQLNYFIKKDKINSFSDFYLDNELHKKYENIISQQEDKFICAFMSK